MYQYSNFDNNFGSGGGTISLIYFSGNFSDVNFSNHSEPVVRVRNKIVSIFAKHIINSCIIMIFSSRI